MKQLLILASLLPALSTAASAQSACPTAADLPAGIAVTDVDGAVETFYAMSPGVVRSEYRGPEGDGSQTLLGQGIYWLQYISVEGSQLIYETKATNSYPMKPADLPLPTPGGAWNSQYAGLSETGYISKGVQASEFGDLTSLTLGSCAYDMIPVSINYLSEGYTEMVHYLPALGIGLLAGSANEGEEMNMTVFLSIAAANEN